MHWNITCDVMDHSLTHLQSAVTMIGPPVALDVFLYPEEKPATYQHGTCGIPVTRSRCSACDKSDSWATRLGMMNTYLWCRQNSGWTQHSYISLSSGKKVFNTQSHNARRGREETIFRIVLLSATGKDTSKAMASILFEPKMTSDVLVVLNMICFGTSEL